MFRKSILFSILSTLLSLLSPSASAADYEICLDTLSHIRGMASDVSEMTLSLSNVNPISAIQFDVTLPGCVTFGYPEMSLDDGRATRSHSLSVNKLSGYTSKYRVLIASSTAKDLKGNDGPLVHMNLIMSTTSSYSGNYYVEVSNIIASESDETQHNISSARGVVRYGYMVGDANGDATVDIADYMATASMILSNSPSPFYSDAANVNNLSSIDVADLVGIANISLGIRPITYRFGTYSGIYAPQQPEGCDAIKMRASGSDRLYIEDFNIEPGETVQVPVLLENATVYSGLQTDLYLPDGLSVDMEDDEYIIDLTSRKDYTHSLSCYEQSDGAIRIFVSSMSAKPFSGSSGAIMTISLTASSGFHGPATVSLRNTICAESIGTKHVLADETCTVNPGAVSVTLGDCNGDGSIDVVDIIVLIDHVLGKNPENFVLANADLNGDGMTDTVDVVMLIDLVLGKG